MEKIFFFLAQAFRLAAFSQMNRPTVPLTRKANGIGTVEAFCRAFAEEEGPTLVVKTMNAAGDPRSRAAIACAKFASLSISSAATRPSNGTCNSHGASTAPSRM